MSGTWVWGRGHYEGPRYVVVDNTGRARLTLFAGLTVGRGRDARQVIWADGRLILPAKHNLPRVDLLSGLEGYWEVAPTGLVFSPVLPEGAKEQATGISLEELLAEFRGFEIARGKRRLVIFIGEEHGRRVAYIPDPDAAPGTTPHRLHQLLSGPHGKAAITALRERATWVATEAPLLGGVMYPKITLDRTATQWQAQTEDGTTINLGDYCTGDHTLDLRELMRRERTVPLALNSSWGEPQGVVGLTAHSGVAYSDCDGDPFKFVVPCQLGESRTIHVVVRHTHGHMVYGFTVARRSTEAAQQEALSLGEDPLTAYTRRAVKFAGNTERRYFVFPDGRVVHLAPIKPLP